MPAAVGATAPHTDPSRPASGAFAPGDFAPDDFAAGDFATGDFATGDFAAGDFATGADVSPGVACPVPSPASPAAQPAPAQPGADNLPVQPWERQPGEPLHWYNAFCAYLAMGWPRSVGRCMTALRADEQGNPGSHGGCDYHIARRWRWAERAATWDAAQLDARTADLRRQDAAIAARRTKLADRALEARERRIDLVDKVLAQVERVFDTANIGAIDEAAARELLPTMRIFLKDLVLLQRLDLGDTPAGQPGSGAGTGTGDGTGAGTGAGAPGAVRYTADDLRRAEQELLQAESFRGKTLLVCIGPDRALMVDMSALRAVKNATGLKLHSITRLTRDTLDDYLQRERALGRPVELVHMAVHAAPDGVEFADGLADGPWLSEQLLGVRVMLLAGCESDRVGNWLGGVTYLLTLSDAVNNDDAALLANHFWRGIADGLGPDAALDRALDKCPPALAEMVTKHW